MQKTVLTLTLCIALSAGAVEYTAPADREINGYS